MRKLLSMIGAVAMAASMPALAEKGGKGGGGDDGRKSAKVQGGGDHGRGHARAGKGHDGGEKFKPHKAERQLARAAKAERKDRDRRVDRRALREQFDTGGRLAGLGRGCPPGLAKKDNGCLPPGQAKKAFGLGERFERDRFAAAAIPSSYRTFYADTPDNFYRYDEDGYIYRVDRRTSLISGLVPLLGSGFAVGQPLPAGYDVYNVPLQFRDTWFDSDEAHYRYGDNAIYQVDPQSSMIENIVALLTGDLNVGQALPAGYDVYNLPVEYRDDYQDSDDDLYRYADGNIYQVDAKTRIIEAIVKMLV